MEHCKNMAADPLPCPIIPPEKHELFAYYFRIPEKAEVKRVAISMLPSSVQKRIRRLDGGTDFTKTPYVIVVSPITMEKFPNSRKEDAEAERSQAKVTFEDPSQSSDGRSAMGKADKRMREEQGDYETYLIPVKCFKDTAMTILQLSQTSKEEKLSLECELPNVNDSLVLNLQVFKMKATALCMYKHQMYLLPESKKKDISNEKSHAPEEGGESKATKSQSEAVTCRSDQMKPEMVLRSSQPKMEEPSTKSDLRHNDLGCVTLRRFSFLPQSHRIVVGASEKSAAVGKLWSEDLRDLPAERNPTDPSSRPASTEESLQITFWKPLERQIKRKLSYEEMFMKKVHLSGSDIKKNSTVANNVFTRSPPKPHVSSSGPPSSLGPQESPTSFLPAKTPSRGKSADLEGLSSSSLLCNIPPCKTPLPLGPGPTGGDNLSPPHQANSSPTSPEMTNNSHEPNDTASPGNPSLIFNHLRSERASLLDIDDTTRDEITQRLLDRVRMFNKIVEDLQQKE